MATPADSTTVKPPSTNTQPEPDIKPESKPEPQPEPQPSLPEEDAKMMNASKPSTEIPPKSSVDTSLSATLQEHDSNSSNEEFSSDLNTNNEIPTQEDLQKIEGLSVLDRDGKLLPFKSIYTGSNVARRVLVIFIRHFFCGNCQEYIRTLSASVDPSTLLHLPNPTFIAVIGCGSPSLIPMYATATGCPFPIYADPTKRLYEAFRMTRTLAPGTRPDYQRNSTLKGVLKSVRQGLGALKGGKAFQAGDLQQVGGEFLFEPVNLATPICSPVDEMDKQLGKGGVGKDNGIGKENLGVEGEEKRITWCHRMKNTRDHAEIPELREVLGLDGEGQPGRNRKRWDMALRERKGTGLTNRTSGSRDRRIGGSNGASSGRASSEKLMGTEEKVKA